MLIRDKVVNELAKEYKLDPLVVRAIVFSPLRFTRNVISTRDDYRPIRIRHFGVFTLKRWYNKAIEDINEMYKVMMMHIDYVYMIMASLLGFQLKDVDSAKRVLKDALDSNDTDKMKFIFREFILHVTPRPV